MHEDSMGHPHGTATLDEGVVARQRYDVVARLDLPRSPPNVAAGNFMIDLRLFKDAPQSPESMLDSQSSLAHSRRTAILTYKSSLVDSLSTAANILWILLGWRHEKETLRVPMMSNVVFSSARGLPKALHVEIQADEKLMIYQAGVEFVTRFTGIRYCLLGGFDLERVRL